MLSRDALEAGSVALHLRIVSQRSSQLAYDPGDVYIGGLSQTIVGPLTISTCSDESGATQIREVPRNFGLIGLENFNTRADAEFVVTQQVNQPEPSVVGKCPKQNFEPVVHSKRITIRRAR